MEKGAAIGLCIRSIRTCPGNTFCKLGKQLIDNLDDNHALKAIENVIAYYKENAKTNERLGKMIERVGLEPFKKAVSV